MKSDTNAHKDDPRRAPYRHPATPRDSSQYQQPNLLPGVSQTLSGDLPGMLPRLRTFALRLCRDHHDAEDLLQRACMRGLEKEAQLRPNSSSLSWMFSIMHSIWINELRARSVRSRFQLDWNDGALLSVIDTGVRTPEQTLSYRQIIKALDDLPESQRLALLLVRVEGLSYADAAMAMKVPVGTVMSRLSRARHSLAVQFSGRTPAEVLKEA